MANHKANDPNEDDKSGTSGGASGQIEFRDFLQSKETLRDDLLPDEKKRLLTIHKEGNEDRVKRRKDLQAQREQLKNGKIPLQVYRQSQGSGMHGQYKMHPILSKSPRLHDPQVIAIPSDNQAQTNPELRERLENRYQLRHAPKYAPTFNPRLTR